MCCAFVGLLLLGPRIIGALWWLFQPLRWEAAFTDFIGGGSLWWIWPVLGLIFLPWTTIMFILVSPDGQDSACPARRAGHALFAIGFCRMPASYSASSSSLHGREHAGRHAVPRHVSYQSCLDRTDAAHQVALAPPICLDQSPGLVQSSRSLIYRHRLPHIHDRTGIGN
jgi:hypothetical protein